MARKSASARQFDGKPLVREILLVGATCAGALLLDATAIKWAHRDASFVLPQPVPVVLPSPNGFQVYLAARHALVNFTPPVDPFMDPTRRKPSDPAYALPRRLAWLAANQKAFALVEKASSLPFLAPPHAGFRPLRPLADALFVASRTEQLDQNWGPSVQYGLDALRMGFKQERGADEDQTLSAERDSFMAFDVLAPVPSKLSSSEAKAAVRTTESLDAHREPFADFLERKRVGNLHMLADLNRGPDWRSFMAIVSGVRPVWKARLELEMVSLGQLLREASKEYENAIASSKRPYESFATPTAPKSKLNRWELVFLWRDGDFDYRLANCHLRLLTLRFALRAFFLDHGHYSQHLQDLVPNYLIKVPTDPFGPGPMHYKSSNEGYTCWSVGPDGVDNDGQPLRNQSRAFVRKNDTGDIVVGPTTDPTDKLPRADRSD